MRKLQSWQESNDLIGKQFAHVPRGGMAVLSCSFSFWMSVQSERKRRGERERRGSEVRLLINLKAALKRDRGSWIGVNEVAACRKLGRTTPYILSPVHAGGLVSSSRSPSSRQINSSTRTVGLPTSLITMSAPTSDFFLSDLPGSLSATPTRRWKNKM